MKISRTIHDMKTLHRFIIALLLYGMLPGSRTIPLTSAQTSANGFTLPQVLSAPFVADLIAAPKGQRIAWVANAEGRRNVWLAEGPQFLPRQLTSHNEDDGQEITSPAFTADGRWIVYVRGGEQNTAGEFPNPTSNTDPLPQAIYAVECATGRVRLLAEGSNPRVSPANDLIVYSADGQIAVISLTENAKPRLLFAARGNNSAPVWSPDGTKLAFVSNRTSHSLIGIYDFNRQTIRWLAPSVDRDSAPRWSPDGRRLAFIRQPTRGTRQRPMFEDAPDPWAIYVAEVASGSAREIWRSGETLTDSLPRTIGEHVLQWGKREDGSDHLVFASEQDGWLRLYSITEKGGAAIALTPTGSEVEDIALSPDQRYIIYSSNEKDVDRRHLHRVSISTAAPGSTAAPITMQITSGETVEWNPVITGNQQHLAFFSSDANKPGIPKILPASGGQVRALMNIPASFPAAQLVTPQQAVFNSADGLEIHGQLFLPRDARAGEKLPAVIFAHGGPMRQMLLGWHYMYYYHNSYGLNQYLASRGYAVLSVNFRSGIGYGRAFREVPGRGPRGATEYQDIVAAARYLQSRADVDASRIGIWGGSYGGYLTALALARDSEMFAVGVDIHGVHDWAQRVAAGPGVDYDIREVRRKALESSPVGSVEKWKSPVLLLHGDDDRNVAFSQTTDLVRRLREMKVPFELMVMPDEVHDFLLHRTWLTVYQASADFLDRHLKSNGQR
jgi:dipeptidyl aminopeptidase/acylaminoacyl peptidase